MVRDGTECRRDLYPGQVRERAVGREEAERQDGQVGVVVLPSDAGERAQLRHERDADEQVAASASDLEVEVGHGRRRAVHDVGRRRRQLELDAGERELEGETAVVDRALALDRQRRRRHRHSHVHGREAVEPCRRVGCHVTHRQRSAVAGTYCQQPANSHSCATVRQRSHAARLSTNAFSFTRVYLGLLVKSNALKQGKVCAKNCLTTSPTIGAYGFFFSGVPHNGVAV